MIKGLKVECILNEDVGDVINDFFVIGSDKIVFLVEDNNYILIKNRKGDFIFERCFDNSIIKICYIDIKGLLLIIINGQNLMDIEFLKKGNDWIFNFVIYYLGLLNVEKKIKQIVVFFKDFDFSNVVD